jgi:prepilin-type N-terminal cleavage/methylation domain-containing protein
MSTTRQSSARRGFTLIELLVVIGLIAVLSAGLGVALSTGGKGTALQSAQGTVNSLLSGARGQAAVRQADAAIMVNITPTSDGFLREFYIATENTSNRWVITGDPVRIDRDVYLVPPATGSGLSSTEVDFDTTNGSWTDLTSTAYETTGGDIALYLADGITRLEDDDGTDLDFRIVQIFNPRGTVDTTSPARPASPEVMKLVLSSAERGANPVLKFNKPQEVRGVLITDYGIPLLVNEAVAFNP